RFPASDYAKLKWQAAQSPYLLSDQKLRSYIYVKAIDKNNNERVAMLGPANPLLWYENFYIFSIIIIISLIIVFYSGLILWKKRRKQ
ncbi:MAG: hypothetical protein NTW06_05100, partial [Candidatus Falkowbacteria bacterium]|nr:hypothetical protein [Candidatus Falkowbacteria bacterium]